MPTMSEIFAQEEREEREDNPSGQPVVQQPPQQPQETLTPPQTSTPPTPTVAPIQDTGEAPTVKHSSLFDLDDEDDDNSNSNKTKLQTYTPEQAKEVVRLDGILTAEEKERGVNPHTLYTDPRWVKAAKAIWALNHSPDTGLGSGAEQFVRGMIDGRTIPKSDKDWADYGWQYMSGFKNNLGLMTLEAAQMSNVPAAQRAAFLYMLEKSDHFQYTWKGTGRALYYMATDPTTYAGLATMGIGLAAATGGKIVTTQALKAALKAGMSRGVTLVATEGAVFSAAANYQEQKAKVAAKGEGKVDLSEVATSAAIGAVVGGALGVIPVAGNALIRQWVPIGSKAPTEIAQSAGDLVATPKRPKEADTPAGVDTPRPLTIRPDSLAVDEGAPTGASGSGPATPPSPEAVNVLKGLVEAADRAVKDIPAQGMKMPAGSVAKIAAPVTKYLNELPAQAREQLFRGLKDLDTSQPEMRVIAEGLRQVVTSLRHESKSLVEQHKVLKNSAVEKDVKASEEVLANVYDNMSPVIRTLLDATSEQGRALADNVKGPLAGDARKLTDPNIAAALGWDVNNLTNAQKVEILEYRNAALDVVEENAKNAQAVKQLEKQANDLSNRGEVGAAYRAAEDARKLKESIIKDELDVLGVRTYGDVAENPDWMDKVAEYIVATVFTPRTIVRNALWPALQTMTRPIQDMLAEGINPASLRRTAAYYGGMRIAAEGAWKAAKVAFDTEKRLLQTAGKDNAAKKFLTTSGAIEGQTGRGLRFFIRATVASDEFFRRLHYEGTAAANTAFDVYVDGLQKGLPQKQIKKNIEKSMKASASRLYDSRLQDTPRLIESLRATGLRKGMDGEELDNWVVQHLQENKSLYHVAKDETAYDAASDLLFDRAFSGKGFASKGAAWYEQNIHRVPIMRLFGQLFFRTPVRVFETGMRHVPGANLFVPNFLADVRGVNGPQARMKALGEQLAGYAIMMSAMSMYAANGLQGSGPVNYDRNAQMRMSGTLVPNSISIGNGTKISLFGLDPLSTPFKIIGTALDRLAEDQYKQAAGADRTASQFHDVTTQLSAIFVATVMSVRDASLVQGAKEVIDIGTMLSSERTAGWGTVGKFLGKKVSLAVPTLVKDSFKLVTNDAIDTTSSSFGGGFLSGLQSSLGAPITAVPTKRDPLGNVAKRNPEGTALNALRMLGLNVSTPEGIRAGRSPTEMKVLAFLDEISNAVDTNYLPPTKAPQDLAGAMAGQDLRDIVLPGKINLYNAWMDEYEKLNPAKKMWTVIRSLRNYDGVGPHEANKAIREVLGSLRQEAWLRTQKKYGKYIGGPGTTANILSIDARNTMTRPVPITNTQQKY